MDEIRESISFKFENEKQRENFHAWLDGKCVDGPAETKVPDAAYLIKLEAALKEIFNCTYEGDPVREIAKRVLGREHE